MTLKHLLENARVIILKNVCKAAASQKLVSITQLLSELELPTNAVMVTWNTTMIACLYAFLAVKMEIVRLQIIALATMASRKMISTGNLIKLNFSAQCTFMSDCTYISSYFRCRPKCTGCKYGECLSPSVCQCNAGYDWDQKASECLPRCENECTNGACTAPGICICNKGYVKHHSLDLCVPHCKGECSNGKCIAPNVCECDTGYRLKNNSLNICQPICDPTCKNGECVEPNTCDCNDNYILHDPNRPHECHCGKYCVEIDGKCHCLDENQRVKGYDFLYGDKSYGNCSGETCRNGYCATPNTCECFFGFYKDENDSCAPLNETCIDETSENCALAINTTVEPSRSTFPCSCTNGICNHENVCYCVQGFTMSNTTADKCIPQCSKECVSFCAIANNILCYLSCWCIMHIYVKINWIVFSDGWLLQWTRDLRVQWWLSYWLEWDRMPSSV